MLEKRKTVENQVMTLSERFAAEHPQAFFVEVSEPQKLTGYLRKQGWIASPQEVTELTPAGQGNMNLVLRVRLDDGRTFILKQSRSWAEKGWRQDKEEKCQYRA